jgi:hypothetical protein
LKFDPELLYMGAIFHDMGLIPQYRSKSDRFEVDGANCAQAFLRQHHISQQDIDTVWTAIALHTTPGIPQYMHPVVALLTNGVEMDVLGIAYSKFCDADRDQRCCRSPTTATNAPTDHGQLISVSSMIVVRKVARIGAVKKNDEM